VDPYQLFYPGSGLAVSVRKTGEVPVNEGPGEFVRKFCRIDPTLGRTGNHFTCVFGGDLA
jgi:hypothetical protein